MAADNHNYDDEPQQSKLPLILSAIFFAGSVIAYFLLPDFRTFVNEAVLVLSTGNQEKISAWLQQFGLGGPLIIILAMVAQMFMIIVPTVTLQLVAVLGYGPIWGTGLALTAIFAASTVGYILGHALGHHTVDKLIGKDTDRKLQHYAEQYGHWAIFITRISPFLSNDAISFVAGLSRMGYWPFIGATLAGSLPLTVLLAYIGRNSERLEQGLFWLFVVSLLGFAAYVYYEQQQQYPTDDETTEQNKQEA